MGISAYTVSNVSTQNCLCTQKVETTNMGLNVLIGKCFGIVMSATGSYQMFLELFEHAYLIKQ